MINDIKSARDQKIREKLKEDKIISAPTLESYENYIYENNIRMNKYSSNQRLIIFILLLIIFISLSFNIKFMLDSKKQTTISEADIQKYMENVIIYSVTPITNTTTTNKVVSEKVENTATLMDNTISNEIEETPENTTFVANVIKHDIFKDDNTEDYNINLEELSTLLEAYSFIIARDNEIESEKNTALLEFATHYFNTKQSQTNSLTVDTKYTKTLDNFNNLFIDTLDITFDSNTPICENYFKYYSASNSYQNGPTYSRLLKETNTISNLKIANFENNEYTGTAYITRTLDDFTKEYKIIFKVIENKEYTYSQYKITSFEVEPVVKELDKSLRLYDNLDVDIDILNNTISEYISGNKKLSITPLYFNIYNITKLETKNDTNTYEISLDIAYQDGTLYSYKSYTAIITYENSYAKIKELIEK